MSRQSRSTQSKTVSFRLDTHLMSSLEARATDVHLSPGKLAQTMVLSVLQDENHLQLMEDFERLQTTVVDLRADIAKTLEVLLINLIGKDKEAVREYVRANLSERR